ncbi:hypothetical protein F5Y10DRAFT_270584 [Nemania abortiva]|nr:hypothetical protein F5Y10DRAFT_270584 [Nemania abortiva]
MPATTYPTPPRPTTPLSEDQIKTITDCAIKALPRRRVMRRLLYMLLASCAAEHLSSIPTVIAAPDMPHTGTHKPRDVTQSLDRLTLFVAAVTMAAPDTGASAALLGLSNSGACYKT